MKIAIVTDWLTVYAGAERVIEQMIACFPEADIFAIADFLPKDQRAFLQEKTVKTSMIQHLPFAKRYYRYYLSLMPLAIEQLDLSAYDLILSSSHAVAKGVITGPHQQHICYIHSPMRYAWDLQSQYLQESHLEHGVRSWLTRYLLHRLRLWDVVSAARVDHFLCNSRYIAQRIKKIYRREATVIYPPVDINNQENNTADCLPIKKDFYMTASRLVPYKKISLIIEAFKQMPDKHLIVIGDGPEMSRIKQNTAKNIDILGYQSTPVLKNYLSQARAFVFAAIEDFGITLVEALACGTPVIAFAQGGAAEIVKDIRQYGNTGTGILYQQQHASALIDAVKYFETCSFSPNICKESTQPFSINAFKHQLKEFVENVAQP